MDHIGWMDLAYAAFGIILLVIRNHFGKVVANEIKLSTSSANQVERLAAEVRDIDTKVMGLQRQFSILNERISKLLPSDDRGHI